MKGFNTVTLGNCNVYLIPSKNGYILVDAGDRKSGKKFANSLRKLGIPPESIQLIIITHVHFDHVRCLDAIKKLCNCTVMVSDIEAGLLRDGVVVLPQGTNRFSSAVMKLGKRLVRSGFFKFKGVTPDITISKETSLLEFGIDANVIPTPGHTAGSLSLLTPDGEAFVGDLAMNFPPTFTYPIFPIFADDSHALIKSWKMLLDLGVTALNPAHGRRFGRELLQNRYEQYKDRFPESSWKI